MRNKQANSNIDLFDPPPTGPYPDGPGYKEKGGTSQEAAAEIAETAATVRAKVLALLQSCAGRTPDEAATELGYSPLTVRPRFSELLKQGLITKTTYRRRNASSGKRASVYMYVGPKEAGAAC